jgi:hypothetical protein
MKANAMGRYGLMGDKVPDQYLNSDHVPGEQVLQVLRGLVHDQSLTPEAAYKVIDDLKKHAKHRR